MNTLERHHAALAKVTSTASRDLQRLLSGVPSTDADRFTKVLTDVLLGLGSKYAKVAATVGAESYEEQRRAVVSGKYSALIPNVNSDERLSIMARWATGPLFQETPNLATTIAKADGGLIRYIADADRLTMTKNVERDKAATGRFGRYAKVGSCSFCNMLAGRGFVYESANSAGSEGHQFHDGCGCTILPEFKP